MTYTIEDARRDRYFEENAYEQDVSIRLVFDITVPVLALNPEDAEERALDMLNNGEIEIDYNYLVEEKITAL